MTFDELLSKAHITTIKMLEQKYDNMTNGEVVESLFPNVGTNFSNIIDLNLWWKAKYKSRNEIHCNCTDEEIAKSFISDVEAIKDYLPSVNPQEPKTELIPKGATNGDVFKIMFNKTFPKTIAMYENDESRLTINLIFSREWWETPYKVESEE